MSQICNAEVKGAEIGASSITFFPGDTKGNHFYFDIGTAGSVSLVLHSVYLPLSTANTQSHVKIKGGTHVPFSPCYHYLELQWMPVLKKIGFDIEVNMNRAGFHPKGNGEIDAIIKPIGKIDNNFKINGLKEIVVNNRGALNVVNGISSVGNLNLNIANRQKEQTIKRLITKGITCNIEVKDMPAFGNGTMVLLSAVFENGQCCYFSLGERGKPAEDVADDVCERLFFFCNRNGVMDEFLIDQLLLPLSLCKGASKIITPKITNHILTNIDVIMKFLPVKIKVEGDLGDEGIVTIN